MAKSKEKNDELIKNVESDIIYAAAVILVSGICGRTIAQSLTESITSGITIGFITVIISLVLSFVIPYFLKQYFKDELNDVLSTPFDFILCSIIMISLAIICKDMIGPLYLVQGISAVIGLSIKYFDMLNILKDRIKNRS